MFRSIALSLMLLFAVPAFAQDATPNPCADLANATKGLSSTETATLLASCRTTSSAPAAIEKMADPETASKWSDAAKGFAEALGIAAKELGIAVNDFLDSPAGYLLALILLFNYAGGFIVGFPMSLISIYALYKVLKMMNTESTEYEMTPVLWGLFSIRRVKRVVKDDGGEYLGLMNFLVILGFVITNLVIWVNVT